MKYYNGIIMLLTRGNKLSLIRVPLRKVKRKYLTQYLLNTVKELEIFSIEKNCWGVRPDIVIILTKLLLNGKEVIFDGQVSTALSQRVVETDFDTITDMEIYTNAFIAQTKRFIDGDTNNKPKIIAEGIIISEVGEVGLLYYLQASDDNMLLESIARLNALAKRLDYCIKEATYARQDILLKILTPVLTPLLVILEQIYEVLNEIN